MALPRHQGGRAPDPEKFMELLYGLHATMEGDVRFIFESLTGMQDLWGSEERILSFYSHSCPRLYELNTIAYWILEKHAHSPRLRAQINQIAQVTIGLNIKRGAISLTILKAEDRDTDNLHKPFVYWTKGLSVVFEEEKRATGRIDLGLRLKEFRIKRGLSQAELSRLVGVTASTISQVESNLTYPSLPALMKMAEVLSVDLTSFFQEQPRSAAGWFSPRPMVEVKLSGLPEGSVFARLLAPVDADHKAEPCIVEVAPKKTLPAHFFFHKGKEIGYVLSGRLQVTVEKAVYHLRPGDLIYLTSEMPTQWNNPGPGMAKILWIKVK